MELVLDREVVIVGAGPTGLTAGLELARRGVNVLVLEKRSSPSTLSRAVGISPASLSIFGPSGVAARLLAEGIRYHHVRFFKGSRKFAHLGFDQVGGSGRFNRLVGLPQSRTEELLRRAFVAFGGEVRFGAEVVGLEQTADRVVLRLADGSELAASMVLGADGADSLIRSSIGIQPKGYDLRGTWSVADVLLTADPADADLFRGLTVAQLGEGAVLAVAPMARDRVRLVSNRESCLNLLPFDWSIGGVRREATFRIGVRHVCRYAVGRVFLAGDAAHTLSPVGGRGMNLGIADGAEFARRFLAGTLDGYCRARRRLVNRTLVGSEVARRVVTGSSWPFRLGGAVALKTVMSAPTLRNAVARGFLFG